MKRVVPLSRNEKQTTFGAGAKIFLSQCFSTEVHVAPDGPYKFLGFTRKSSGDPQ